MLFLYGAYGCNNHGDDLICMSALTRYPNAKIFLMYTHPIINLNLSNVFITNEDPDIVIDVLNKSKGLEKVELKFAGGGLFWSVEHISSMLKIAKFCVENNIVVSMERVGLHGAQYSPSNSLQLLECMTSISVRDKSSLELISGMGLNVDIDISVNRCFTFFLPRLKHINPVVSICYINLNVWLNNNIDDVLNLITKLKTHFKHIKFIYLIQTRHIKAQHGEERHINNLKKILDVINPETPSEYYNTFKDAKYVISSGYHTALLPAMNNIRVFQIVQGVDNQTKYLAVAKEMCLDYYVQSIYQPFNTKKIFDRLCEFIKEYHA